MYPYVHCSIIYNSQDEQPEYPSMEDQIEKMWYLYTIEYYPAIKR